MPARQLSTRRLTAETVNGQVSRPWGWQVKQGLPYGWLVARRTHTAPQPMGVTGDVRAPVGQAAVLADLAPGCQATVVGLAADAPPATVRRLADLGFTAGTTVQVVRRAPLRDPVIYRVKDYDLCLRRAQATCVLVREVG
jgi:ferrous iron transport protein A